MIGTPILLHLFLNALWIMLQAQSPLLTGRWIGQLDLAGEATVFRLNGTSGSATVDLLPSGPSALPVQGLSSQESGIHFELPLGPSSLVFNGRSDAQEIAGTVRRDGAEGRFRMLRLADLEPSRRELVTGNYETESGRVIWVGPFGEFGADLYVLDYATGRFGALYPRSETTFVAGPAIVTPLFPLALTLTFEPDDKGQITGLLYQEGDHPAIGASRARRRDLTREEVSFRNGDVTLAGMLTLPPKKGPHPAIVLIHGSGPEDRNFLGPWIDFFARQGLAVLSYDKRGVGASGGDWQDAGFEELAGDAQAAFRYLAGRGDVDRRRIGLFGISQGGWIAPLIASRHPEVAFIVLHAGASVTAARQGELHLEHELRAYGLPEEEIAAALAYKRLDDGYTRTGQGWEKLQAADRKAREAPAQWLYADLLPADAPFRRMFRKMMDFDPAAAWRQVKCPVLAFFGELDLNVPPQPNREILEKTLASAGHTAHTIRVLPKANHLFLQAETGVMTEYPRLRGFVPEYFTELGGWLQKVVPLSNPAM